MDLGDRIFVAGHRGLVGSAIVRRLAAEGFDNLVLRSRAELDLCDQAAVREFFAAERPAYVFVAAAKVGGIHANSAYPADFIRDNLLIAANVIEAAWRSGTAKLLYLGAGCLYPRLAPQPMREDCLLSGPLEPTNEWYAVAKIAGIKLCQAFARQHGFRAISLVPANAYGPGDNFHPENSHVIPGLIRRFHAAKLAGEPRVEVWGSGRPLREFLHVDDLADACLFAMRRYESPEILNVGAGEEVSIRDLAGLVREVVGYSGEVVFDASRPDGAPRKLLDPARLLALGWKPRIPLRQGLAETYAWYLEHLGEPRGGS
jgi:GDP-L-fucose synthase